MQIDAITLKDLDIFAQSNRGHEYSIYHLLDECVTYKGRQILSDILLHPPSTFEKLLAQQKVVSYLTEINFAFSHHVTNGTVVMIDKFLEDAEAGALPPGKINLAITGMIQRVMNRQAYFLTRFSLVHVADLVKGCFSLIDQFEDKGIPEMLQQELEGMVQHLRHPIMEELKNLGAHESYAHMATLTYKTRRHLKKQIEGLLHHFSRIDAWRSMSQAGLKRGWHFPHLLPSSPTTLELTNFYHPLLVNPVPYSLALARNTNFLILTGANMSGKTTFMRALGIVVLLAHVGCAIPAEHGRISFLEGVTTNMHVEDNLMMGESYFLAEVKRMKKTAEKVAQLPPRLFLMDELFKGTNVQDAYDCTKAVISGMKHHPQHLLILSTHLYEVAQYFSQERNLQFAYFVTEINEDGGFRFTYSLKSGISNDRIGYNILKQEGVLELLGNVAQS